MCIKNFTIHTPFPRHQINPTLNTPGMENVCATMTTSASACQLQRRSARQKAAVWALINPKTLNPKPLGAYKP